MHRIHRDEAQVLTDAVQSDGGLIQSAVPEGGA